ncbi:MAG: serine/threonine-protein kinase [Myxococcota bacterium]
MAETSSKPVPKRFGRYRIYSKLAAGGMATVYLARTEHKTGFEKIVALKVIHDHLHTEQSFVDMFLDEARIAAGIDHPNVCSVFDFGEENGVYYIAMEYLLGEPIKRIARTIAKSKDRNAIQRLPFYIARALADASEGLHAAHELKDATGNPLGVVHRDVSPENIVVTYDGGVKLVDFGVAKAAQRIHKTKINKIKGKFAYVAPEQIRNQDVDRRADIWGLGVCLWEALTLRRLFRRETDASTLSAVIYDDVPAPSELASWVHPTLDKIVLRALARDREQRYPTARALGQDLRKFLTQTGMTIGSAEVSEWMEKLFPDERQSRLDMLQRARRGEPSGSFVEESQDDVASVPDGSLPSVSVLVSPPEDRKTPELVGISLEAFADMLHAKGAQLDEDVAGLIAMDICDALQERPARVDTQLVRVTEDGAVSLGLPLVPARPADSARCVTEVLKFLPMRRGPLLSMLRAAEFRSPEELNEALQKAIDPVARGKARREIVRLMLMPAGPVTMPPPARRKPEPVDPLVKFAEDATGSFNHDRDPLPAPAPVPSVTTEDDLTAFKSGGNGLRNGLIALAVLGAVAATVAIAQPERVRSWFGVNEAPAEAEADPEPETIVQEPILGELRLHVAPEGARVLLFVGRAPIDVENVAQGQRHYIMAAQDNGANRWGQVPAEGEWTDGQYELAIAFPEEGEDEDDGTVADMEPSPSASGDGRIRVVTQPPGAKVYRFAGIAPEITIGGVDPETMIEVLVTLEGYESHRALVTSSEWTGEERPTAELRIELQPEPRRRR